MAWLWHTCDLLYQIEKFLLALNRLSIHTTIENKNIFLRCPCCMVIPFNCGSADIFSILGKWRLYVSHLRIDEKSRINPPHTASFFHRRFFLCDRNMPVTYVLVCNRWVRLCAKTSMFWLNKSTLGVIITRNLSSTYFEHPFSVRWLYTVRLK